MITQRKDSYILIIENIYNDNLLIVLITYLKTFKSEIMINYIRILRINTQQIIINHIQTTFHIYFLFYYYICFSSKSSQIHSEFTQEFINQTNENIKNKKQKIWIYISKS
ncbi:hypothetical protein pb186bvf_021165 [Paramecium bursaria]